MHVGSEMENGAQVQAMAEEVVRAIMGPLGSLAGSLADAMNYSTAAINAAQDPLGPIGEILGEGHPGIDAIAGPAAAVVEIIEGIQAKVQAAVADVEQAQGAADTLGFTIDNVGSQIARGGQ